MMDVNWGSDIFGAEGFSLIRVSLQFNSNAKLGDVMRLGWS